MIVDLMISPLAYTITVDPDHSSVPSSMI